jgi:hypothetical protein
VPSTLQLIPFFTSGRNTSKLIVILLERSFIKEFLNFCLYIPSLNLQTSLLSHYHLRVFNPSLPSSTCLTFTMFSLREGITPSGYLQQKLSKLMLHFSYGVPYVG